MRLIIVNENALGYGSSVVEGFIKAGISASLETYNFRGVWPLLRDKIFPKYRINFFRNRAIWAFEEKVMKTIDESETEGVIFLLGAVIISARLLKWMETNHPSVKRVLWCYDTLENNKGVKPILPLIDKVFTFMPRDVPIIPNHTKASAQLLPLFNNGHYKRLPNISKDIDICFIGSWNGGTYVERRQLLRKVSKISRQYGWKFVVVGGAGLTAPIKYVRDLFLARGFMRNVQPGCLSHEEINLLYQRSKVVVNCPTDNQKEAFPFRLFEVPGSGTCLITQCKGDLDKYYSSNEMIAFDDLNDLEAILKDILKDDDKRKRIAHAGREKTEKDHMIGNRIMTLVSEMEKLN
jgi:hypothetical protein